MIQHTPGPWTSYNASGGRIFKQWRVIDSEKLLVATVAERPGGESELANARLIAAAPDMLAALQALFEHCSMVHKYWGSNCNQKEADAAIQAARLAIDRATNPTP